MHFLNLVVKGLKSSRKADLDHALISAWPLPRSPGHVAPRAAVPRRHGAAARPGFMSKPGAPVAASVKWPARCVGGCCTRRLFVAVRLVAENEAVRRCLLQNATVSDLWSILRITWRIMPVDGVSYFASLETPTVSTFLKWREMPSSSSLSIPAVTTRDVDPVFFAFSKLFSTTSQFMHRSQSIPLSLSLSLSLSPFFSVDFFHDCSLFFPHLSHVVLEI